MRAWRLLPAPAKRQKARTRRIVIDTNIVLSGLLWRGPPYVLLTHIGQNPGMQLFSSQALIDELAAVLIRPSPAKRLKLINKTAHEVLALALLAQAQAIISGDNDLLVLQSFEGIAILTAAQALQQLEVVG